MNSIKLIFLLAYWKANHSIKFLAFIQGPPKRPDTFENLIEIKRVDENN